METVKVLVAALCLLSPAAGAASYGGKDAMHPSTITKAAEDVIGWVQSVIDDVTKWVPPGSKDFVWNRSRNPRGWVQGAFLVGMKDWAAAADDEVHWQYLKSFAEAQGYQMGERIYHADDHVVGQYYAALAEHYNMPAALEPMQEQLDHILDSPSSKDLNFSIPSTPEEAALDYAQTCLFRWCWCDALFMSPPTFMALSRATGDPKYLEFADEEYFVTTDYLFREFDDMPGGLYLRDSTFFDPIEDKRDENGDFIFWSRGNGWVFAGLPAVLEAMPFAFPGREGYIDIYMKMAQALKATQVTEGQYAGFWGPSLRAFDLFSTPESSGTAFFVGGMAWGVAEGLLPADEYLDVVKSGWRALLSVQAEDGSIGWTQQIGSQPDSVAADNVQLYGCGGFLQAAAGMLRLHEMGMLGDSAPYPTSYLGSYGT